MRRLALTYEHASVGIAEVDRGGRFARVNDFFARFLGLTSPDLIGRRFCDFIHPEDLPCSESLFAQQMAGDLATYTYEKRYVCADGAVRWAAVVASVVAAGDGVPQYGVRIIHDVTEAHKAEDRQRLTIRELHHRVRNTLAVAQAIATQTLMGAGVDRDVVGRLVGRFQALAKASAIMSHEDCPQGGLRDLVAAVLSVHPRVTFDGPDARLSPPQGVCVALVLHELATNAAKYGALLVPTGSVAVTWSLDGGELRLAWRERGGPAVAAPACRGFGSKLVERLTKAEGGRLAVRFPYEGVAVDLILPLSLQTDLLAAE